MVMTEQSCRSFVEALAGSAPAPGGGGAAALVGAIGAALGNMVGSLTVGKKTYSAVEGEILALKGRLTALQGGLLELAEKDAEVFLPLSRAYGLPTQTQVQRAEKARIMSAALREASAVPMEMMDLCMQALPLIERMAGIGSRLAVSDAGCAAACCRGALHAAALNVFINTKAMEDRELADKLNARAEAMLREGAAQADAIFEAVRVQLY